MDQQVTDVKEIRGAFLTTLGTVDLPAHYVRPFGSRGGRGRGEKGTINGWVGPTGCNRWGIDGGMKKVCAGRGNRTLGNLA
jgi:hypothetical protein